jgi:BioD-like phosphotransacetylase family protein
MSESVPATAVPSPVIVRIVSDHARAIEALAAASADSLDHATLRSSYENAINLARALHSSENLTDRFAALVTENEDLALERDAAVADRNALTARVTQLEAQLMPQRIDRPREVHRGGSRQAEVLCGPASLTAYRPPRRIPE